eukprot:m.144286 g.144286  ORF g.144286 m.144286 type:complete len:105 (-) comp30363_c2_seq1:505-819(-)
MMLNKHKLTTSTSTSTSAHITISITINITIKLHHHHHQPQPQPQPQHPKPPEKNEQTNKHDRRIVENSITHIHTGVISSQVIGNYLKERERASERENVCVRARV